MKITSFVVLSVLGSTALPVWSQNALPIKQSGVEQSGASSGVSLSRLLQLSAAQIEQLNRFYSEFAAREAAQQAKTRSPQSVEKARQKVAADWRSTRARARQFLPPVQRSQLDSIANDPRFQLRRDSFYQLLAPGEAEFVAVSALKSDEARHNWLEARRLENFNGNAARGTGSYGVYGGTGYSGPQAGIYGGYQQGAVGVHAGVGSGGPSVGISIGRVFGVGRR